MEIVVRRIAKKKTYTIGRLYILEDGEVERRVGPGKHQEDKRIIRHDFDTGKLDETHYFCDTLEPTWRNLLASNSRPRRWTQDTAESRARRHARCLARRRYLRELIPWWCRGRLGSGDGCLWCKACLASRASASIRAISPMIRKAASSWAATRWWEW